MDLVTFLAARLDEDEAAAKMAIPMWMPREVQIELDDPEHYAFRATTITPSIAQHIARHGPARVLREIEAKRRRLERYMEEPGYDLPEGVYEGRDQDERETDEAVKGALETEVREDAAVYSDHPDYDQAWKP